MSNSSSFGFVNKINLSDVPNIKKEKIYSFINENQIKFNKDENGDSFAMVKFENPENSNSNIIKNKKEDKKNNSIISTEILPKVYFNFFSLVKPMVGIRPKKITLYDLRYYIEEIYSVAFLKYTQILKMKSNDNNEIIFPSFPSFIFEFIVNKYAKKQLIDQTCMNILLSLEYFKLNFEDIKLFSNFLNENYNNEDLLFFLFLRSNIEKNLGVSILEKAKDDTIIQHKEDKEEIFMNLYLNQKQISKIITTIYNCDDEILLNQVLQRLEPFYEGNSQKYIFNIYIFLTCLTDDYHLSREKYDESQGINNIPFFYNKQNEFFDLSGNSEGNEHDIFMNMVYYFNSQSFDFQDTLINIIITYIKEKEIFIFFEKYFVEEFPNDESNDNIIYDFRNSVMKKIYFLINIVFNEDIRSWNASFEIDNNENDIHENKTFSDLIKLKNNLMNSKTIVDINENLLEKFCNILLSDPLLLNQITKMISLKKQSLFSKN